MRFCDLPFHRNGIVQALYSFLNCNETSTKPPCVIADCLFRFELPCEKAKNSGKCMCARLFFVDRLNLLSFPFLIFQESALNFQLKLVKWMRWQDNQVQNSAKEAVNTSDTWQQRCIRRCYNMYYTVVVVIASLRLLFIRNLYIRLLLVRRENEQDWLAFEIQHC